MNAPPWMPALRRAARRTGEAGEAAARAADRFDRLDEYGRRVVAALTGASVEVRGDRGLTPSGAPRVAVEGVRLGSGELVDVPGARGLREDWEADPARAVLRVSSCSTSWPIRQRTSDGRWVAQPMTCGCSICPRCVVAGLVERRDKWQAALSWLHEHGYRLVLLTRTRRAVRPADPLPVVWTADDRERWGDCPHPTEHPDYSVGYAVPGESLDAAWDALTTASRTVIDSRGIVSWRGMPVSRREWWARSVVAQLDAIEATQVRETDEGLIDWLRWHLHGHMLLVLDPSALGPDDVRADGTLDPSGEWYAAWLAGWTSEVDAQVEAQDARVLDAGNIEKSLREVIKYAGQLDSMTQAGVIEWLTTTKGRRPHRAGGALHGATKRGRAARAVSLLAQLTDAEDTAEGAGDTAELRSELAGVLRDHLPVTSADDARSRVDALVDALTGWEAQHARDVGAALHAAARAAADDAAQRATAGMVEDRPRAELGENERGEHSHRRLLTYARIRQLLQAGVRWTTPGDWTCDGVAMPRIDVRAVLREVTALPDYVSSQARNDIHGSSDPPRGRRGTRQPGAGSATMSGASGGGG